IANRGVTIQEPSCCVREDDLPSVCSGSDPRRAVNVDADVAFVRHDRLARVDTHAYADLTGFELPPRFGSRSNGVAGSRKSDEERIALRVDLDTGVLGECVSEDTPVLGEQIGVSRSVLLQESRRALDV